MSEDSRLQRVMQMLTAVLERPAVERLDYLQQECVDDERLLYELQSLLQHHEQAKKEDFLGGQSSGAERVALDRNQLDRDTTAQHNASTPNNALRVRCPHCHTPTSVAVDASLEDISCPSCGSVFSLVSDDNATHSAATMSQIGHFELIERLGFGGFGSVWKARDTKLDRTVAVKLPRQGQMDAAATEKFFREARAAAQLRHPNIVGVHEVGRDDGSIYIVSDFVRGVTLDDWLTGQQLTSREAAELCIPIAEALQHAHEQGIVHRDLKPGNIMLDGDGVPHLMDFGLARREVGEVTMTIDGQVLGTPAYMSPEQAEGQAHIADRRSDIYSLGVILFKLVTGELPFRGNTRMLIHKVINNEPPSPRTLNANVPRDLETIVLKCMEKDPERRYPTAQDLADELRRFLNHEPIHARPVGRLERSWRWCKRNPVVAGLTGVVALSLLGGVVVSSFFAVNAAQRAREAISERKKAQANLVEANAQRERAETNRGEANLRLVENHLQQSLALYGKGDTSSAVVSLAHTLEVVPEIPNDLSTLIRRLVRVWNGQIMVHPLAVHESEIRMSAGAIAPDGKTIAIGHHDGSVLLIRPNVRHRLMGPQELSISGLEFSKNGKWLAAAGTRFPDPPGKDGERAWIWNLSNYQLACPPLQHRGHVYGLAFTPDSSKLMTGDSTGHSMLWDVSTGQQLREPTFHGENYWIDAISISPDGKTVLCTGTPDNGNSGVTLWDIETGASTGKFFVTADEVDEVVFSPNGNTFATGDRAGLVQIWDVETGESIGKPIELDQWIQHIVFNGDGSLLATTEGDFVRFWNANTGLPVGEPVRLPQEVETLASDGGNLILSVSKNRAVTWKVQTPVKLQPMNSINVGSPVVMAAYNSDGTQIISVSSLSQDENTWDGGILKVWDIESGQQIGEPYRSPQAVYSAAFNDDASKIATGTTDGICTLIDIATGKLVTDPVDVKRPVAELVLHPNEDQFVVVSKADLTAEDRIFTAHIAELWSFTSRKRIGQPMHHPLVCRTPAFSPDGTILVTPCKDGLVRYWDVGTGKLIGKPLRTGSSVDCVKMSPDGSLIALSTDKLEVAVWDVESRSRICDWLSHNNRIYCIAFSPNGDYLATATGRWGDTQPGEAHVTVWSVRTGKKIAVWEHPHHVCSVVFHPKGDLLVSSSLDSKVRILKLPAPIDGEPEQVRLWAELATGIKLQGGGVTTFLNAEEYSQRQVRLMDVGGSPVRSD